MRFEYRRVFGISATLMLLVFTTGCELLAIAEPKATTLRLQNDGDFEVRVRLYVDEVQSVPEDLIDDVGAQLDVTLAPGEVHVFRRDCDALQAVVVEVAELMVIGSVGPEAGSDVLRDGDDFGCGDTITFTFDHSQIFTDFHVDVAVSASR